MEFHKLTSHGNEMSITHKKPFDTESKAFKPETIKRVFDFAYDMTFGNKGAHKVHRTGGTTNRKQGEIFSNTFQGKLAECAACNLLYKVDMVIDAYARRSYHGNLADLFEPGHGPTFAPYVIDNDRFPSDWFEKTSVCSKNCESCYCEAIKEKVFVNSELM